MYTETPEITTEVTNLTNKIEGTAEPNSSIRILNSNNIEIGSAVADSEGNFSVDIPEQPVSEKLSVFATAPDKLESKPAEITVKSIELYSVEFLKIDEDNQPLPGAEFTLVNDNYNIQSTSRDDGKVAFENLLPGAYTLSEAKAPEGYITSETTYEVVITEEGKITIDGVEYDPENLLTIENKKEPQFGSLKVIKHDADDKNEKLSGAVFELRSKDSEQVFEETTSDEGEINFVDIPFGDYELVEVKAPNGYKLDQMPRDITINAGNIIQEIEVENSKAELPQTGGSGTLLFTIMGLTFITIGLYIIRNRNMKYS